MTATLDPRLSSVLSAKGKGSPSPVRLPPIAQLLSRYDGNSAVATNPATGEPSLQHFGLPGAWTDISPFARPSTPSTSVLPQSAPTTAAAVPSVPGSVASPNKQSLLQALPPIATDLHDAREQSATYGKAPLGSQERSSAGSQRLPSMQLVSPTGGPLYPRPSGLVGYPPMSPPLTSASTPTPSSLASATSFGRPRSNSLSSAAAPQPYHTTWPSPHMWQSGPPSTSSTPDLSRRRSVLEDDRRHSMVSTTSTTSSSGWSAADPAVRMRKRGSDAHLHAADASNAARFNRPRTSSNTSAEERSGTPAWAPVDDPRMRDTSALALSDRASADSAGSSPATPYPNEASPRESIDDGSGRRFSASSSAPAGYLAPHMHGAIDALSSLAAAASERMDERTASPARRSMESAPVPTPSGHTMALPAQPRPLHNDLAALHIAATQQQRAAGLTAPSAAPWPSVTAPVPSPSTSPGKSLARSPSVGSSSFPSHLSTPDDSLQSASGSSGEGSAEVGRYGCPHCPKRFARPSSLRTHIHSHTGEKPYTCALCGRGFSVQSNLRRHSKIHRTSNGSNAAGRQPAESSDSAVMGAGSRSPPEGALMDLEEHGEEAVTDESDEPAGGNRQG